MNTEHMNTGHPNNGHLNTGYRNPWQVNPAPPRTFNILAVCTANICRSPMIELLLRKRLDPSRFEVASAGVYGWNRAPVDSMVTLELARFGASAKGFQSRALSDEDIEQADLILAATRDHRAHILGRSPDALRKTYTLLEFAALMEGDDEDVVWASSPEVLVEDAFKRRSRARQDIDLPDPYRQPPDVHRRVAEQVRQAVDVVATRLADSAR